MCSRLSAVHAWGETTASHPQPEAWATNGEGQDVIPTGAQSVVPMAARVPGAHESATMGVHPASFGSEEKPSGHDAAGGAGGGVVGDAPLFELPHAISVKKRREEARTGRCTGVP